MRTRASNRSMSTPRQMRDEFPKSNRTSTNPNDGIGDARSSAAADKARLAGMEPAQTPPKEFRRLSPLAKEGFPRSISSFDLAPMPCTSDCFRHSLSAGSAFSGIRDIGWPPSIPSTFKRQIRPLHVFKNVFCFSSRSSLLNPDAEPHAAVVIDAVVIDGVVCIAIVLAQWTCQGPSDRIHERPARCRDVCIAE